MFPASRRVLIPALILLTWAGGMLLAFHPIILSGFARMQVDPIDTRFVNYVLEHSWLWLTGAAGHESFWSPPIFYPAENSAAYSELFLTVAPLYWVWRAFGLLPDTSYQLWLLAVSTVNFAVAFLVLRRAFRLSPLAANLGAAVFSFASPRLQQLNHPQLVPGFWVLLVVLAIAGLLDHRRLSRRSIWLHAALLSGALAAQLWTSFYVGWFLGLVLVVGLSIALLRRDSRGRLVEMGRATAVPVLVCAFVAALSLAPMASHYLDAARAVGARSFDEALPMLPRLHSWLYAGPHSWVYGGLAGVAPFSGLPMEHEHRLGAGLLTTGLAIAGLVIHRRNAAVAVGTLAVLIVCTLATILPGGLTAWGLVFDHLPGGSAIRAVSRVGLLAIAPIALGLGLLAERVLSGEWRWRLVVPAITVACLLEQGTGFFHYDKQRVRVEVDALARAIPEQCEVFLYTPPPGRWIWLKDHVDAMWAGLATGRPTINGYSGNHPPGWDFRDIRLRGQEDGVRLGTALVRWADLHGLDPRAVTWIQRRPSGGDDGTRRAARVRSVRPLAR